MIDIYGTIGPKCQTSEILKDMFMLGMTGMRLNLSHSTLKESENKIILIHEAANSCGIKAKILIDMQGPELRIGKLSEELELKENETINLKKIPFPDITKPYLLAGQQILLDDGKLLLKVVSDSRAEIVRGGKLLSGKSIALPDCDIYPDTMTKQDKENIKLASSYGVTAVMQPFVRNSDDLKTVRSYMDENGAKDIKLMAKIENLAGVENLESFFGIADEIVIARGDLGNAMPLWELPGVQKDISKRCKERDIPFMVVTQMLDSMHHRAVPTRAEVSDIYNAVLDGASSVMVTGETAVGDYPVETIRYLVNTARQACDN